MRLCCALLGWIALQAGADDQPPDRLHLLGRSAVNAQAAALELDREDRRWLWSHRTLRLAISRPDYPPFDMTGAGRDFEGITADYAGLVGQLLNVQIEVLRYRTRDQAIAALRRGDVDLLGTVNEAEAASAELLLSQAYGADQTVLARRVDLPDSLVKHRSTQRLAMVRQYLPDEVVRLLYPQSKVQEYETPLAGLGAVAFGQADLYLGNALGSGYQLGRSQLNNVQLIPVPELDEQRFGFAVRPDNGRLLGLIDSALNVIEPWERRLILRRWSVEGVVVAPQATVPLTAAEHRWVRRHPRVKVLIDEQLLPISYRDEHGRFRGISAQVLEAISQRTGLIFDVQPGSSVAQMSDRVARGEAQLLAALASSGTREEQLLFSRPYLNSAMVLVARDTPSAPTSLDQLHGRKVAVLQGSYLLDELHERYPGVTLLQASTVSDALALVSQQKAEGAILSLISARYQVAAHYAGELRISAALPISPVNIAFATARGEQELLSILDKALLSIEPQELDALTKRSYPHVIVAEGYWHQRRTMFLRLVLAGIALLLVAFSWITWLRRQIRRRIVAECALTDQLQFMRVMIDGTPHPLYVRDRQGLLLNCNASYLQALGQDRESVIGKPINNSTAVDPQQAQLYQDAYLKVMAEGTPIIEDRALTLASGETLTIHHWVLPYQASGGETVGLIAGWIDITERERLCVAYQQATQEAEAANQAKTHFLATMSHEIRTPMNAVLGMLELALKKADEGRLDRLAIEVAAEAAQGLLDLIGDILDITRIEGGHLQLTPRPVALAPWLQAVVRVFEQQARHKGLTLMTQLSGEVDREVMFDPVRLRQVLANLLGNAIKFTETGQISVSLDVQPEDAGLRLRLCVADTGVGIAEHEQAVLGQPFTQANNQAAGGRGGAGLGLSISRALCELMGGDLRLHSRVGQGTRVTVSLPITQVSTQAGKGLPPPAQGLDLAPGEEAFHGWRILVVDDYPANRLLLDQQLTYLGHSVVLAEDGVEAFDRWKAERFDLVITDCNMPDGDGYVLAGRIRESERSRRLSPCVVLGCTANALPEERQRCLQAGMDDCLFKPLSLAQMAERLGEIMPCPVSSDGGEAVDLSELRRLTGGCESTLEQLLETLRRCHREDAERLDVIIASGDLEPVGSLVHRISGAARLIRARSVLVACDLCERLLDEEDEGIEAALLTLRAALGEMAQALQPGGTAGV